MSALKLNHQQAGEILKRYQSALFEARTEDERMSAIVQLLCDAYSPQELKELAERGWREAVS